MSREIIVAGNWKMNASKDTTNTLVSSILVGMPDVQNKVIVCVPFPYLSQVESLIVGSRVKLGAQNINLNQSGAFTGETSGAMIKDFANFVIVGHSERRSLYGESNEIVAQKVQVALDAGLTPIFCIGEELADRKSGNTMEVVNAQLNAAINKVGIEKFRNIIIAYEPVWAIGTGITATPQQAQQTHADIRMSLTKFNQDIANNVSILYGGSMNPTNAAQLLACSDIDGGLIGGASLNASDFLTICKAG